MPFLDSLKELFETQEHQTVGSAFGGAGGGGRSSYSVTAIRDWIISQRPFAGQTPIEQSLRRANQLFPAATFRLRDGLRDVP